MDGVQLPHGQSHVEETVYFLPLSSQKFLVLFYRLRKDKRLSQPCSHSVVLNTEPLDWEYSTLTTRPLLHKSHCSFNMEKRKLVMKYLLKIKMHAIACLIGSRHVINRLPVNFYIARFVYCIRYFDYILTHQFFISYFLILGRNGKQAY